MRSPRIMSILLYGLGAALFVWSALMLLSGETFATIDIAANLAGWGALTIGLGALTAAVERLARNIVSRGETAPRPDPAKDVLPVFVPRGADPARFEPGPASAAIDDAEQPRRAKHEGEPDVVAKAAEASSFAGDDPDLGKEDAGLNRKDRRARKLLARRQAASSVEEPLVSEPALGATATSEAAPLSAPERRDRTAGPSRETGDRAADASSERPRPGEMFVRARPIMAVRIDPPMVPPVSEASPVAALGRNDQVPNLRDAEPAPEPRADLDLPIAGEASTDAATTEAAPELASGRDPDQPTGAIEAPAVSKKVADAREPKPVEPEPEPAPAPEHKPAPAPERRPAPSDFGAPADAVRDDPKIPEWLARARARREARAKSEAPAVESGQVETAPIPVFRSDPAVEPVAPPVGSETPPEPGAPSSEALDDLAPPAEADEAVEAKIVSEGEHNGVIYRFFDDGAVEAASPSGVRRFASVDDLRATVRNARGQDDADATLDEGALHVDPEAGLAPRPDLENSPLSKGEAGSDPLDEALAELEREPQAAPELRIDPVDRLSPRETR